MAQENPWRETLAPYSRPHLGRSILDVVTSAVPYLALSYAMYALLDVSYPLTLAVGVLAAGFLLRTYIVFHDCTHGSFMPTKRANAWLGRFVGLLVWTPFGAWRHEHAVHHATAGDLDRRGVGDVPTMTLAEYRDASPFARFVYRLFRSPFVMFTIGPIFALIVQPRIMSFSERPRLVRSVHSTNVVLLLVVGALGWLIGPLAFVAVWLPPVMLAGAAGVFLFYVQHQFEDVFWESSENWSYADAALRGSSYLKLPKVLQYFTGNIGLHHVHHLSARVPNYNLQRAHDENPVFHDVPTLTLWDGIKATRLKLWDEDRRKLLTWAETREALAPAPAAAATA